MRASTALGTTAEVLGPCGLDKEARPEDQYRLVVAKSVEVARLASQLSRH